MRYRGFSRGRWSVLRVTIRQKSSFSSPPLRPPIAKPGTSRLVISAVGGISFHHQCLTARLLHLQLDMKVKRDILSFSPSRQALRRSAFSPPWIMAKRFCLSGFLLAAMQRSSQRMDRCIASSTRGPVTVLLTTSSSCIMISDPGRRRDRHGHGPLATGQTRGLCYCHSYLNQHSRPKLF